MSWQNNRAANSGFSLRASLEDAGITNPAPFMAEYQRFASECRARNPLVRPTIGRYVGAVKANGLKLLG